jgi:hypothetical protein
MFRSVVVATRLKGLSYLVHRWSAQARNWRKWGHSWTGSERSLHSVFIVRISTKRFLRKRTFHKGITKITNNLPQSWSCSQFPQSPPDPFPVGEMAYSFYKWEIAEFSVRKTVVLIKLYCSLSLWAVNFNIPTYKLTFFSEKLSFQHFVLL